MEENRNVRVLLLEGFARQVMPLMEALHNLGCHLTTYNTSKLDMGYASRYPDKKLLSFWNREDENGSLEALIKVLKNDKYDVVIPLTDFSATLLSKNKEKLSKYAAMAVNDWDVFRMASDKQNTMIACMENNIPCPYTLRDVETIDDILKSEIKYPFVIKPRIGYGSIGFHCINNEQQLRKVFDNATKRHGKMLVQEYIPQTGIQYKAEVFIDRDGNVKSACVFDKTRWYPIDGGSTCCSATVERPDIVANSVKLLKTIGWKGYGDVDLIQDPRDGSVKVMEINPRITASVKVCMVAGVDFARQIVEYETGREVTEFKNYNVDCRLRYMHTDILWFLQSPNRFRSKPSWFNFERTTDQIFSIKDPWPWVTYSIQAATKLIPELRKRKRK
ncbi:Ribosomal protein S6--L-glutamate ligase [bioreactor metagenome]|uniref:Ribosomal protein S6--L-glutamate ligase n=1 Tax=bioreactor metagenome TaxID=1076179 RepID=A0A645ANE8_9ZZZZ